MNDKLTPEIAALITNIEENGGNNHGADDYSYLMEALAALKSLAQQVQLLKGADEERARLRKALEWLSDDPENSAAWKSAYEGLAASPTGYTERLEQALREINAEPEDHDNYSWIRRKVREALGVK